VSITSGRVVVARRAPLAIVASTSVALFGIVYALGERTAFGQRLDDAALRGRVRDSPIQHAVERALDSVSVTSLVIATCALIAVAMLRGRPRLAFGVGLLVVGANVSTQILKGVLSRPNLDGALGAAHTSFPSGHSTVAMSLALALVLAVPSRLRIPVGIAGLGYAFVVGAATVTGAWHRPSDVLGADLVTLAWAAAIAAWLVTPHRDPVPRSTGGVLAETLVVVASLAFVAAAVAVGVDVVNDAGLGDVTVGRAYVLAILAIAVGAAITLAVLIAALDGAALD
jgi:PAP2 superfamily